MRSRNLTIRTTILLACTLSLSTEAQSSPSQKEVKEWLAIQIAEKSGSSNNDGLWETTRTYSLNDSGGCEITFGEVLRSSNSQQGFVLSRTTTTSTTIPLSKISTNSLEIRQGNLNQSYIFFNAAKGKPYHSKSTTVETQTGQTDKTNSNESDKSAFSFSINGESIANRIMRALHYLADQCNAENEPF